MWVSSKYPSAVAVLLMLTACTPSKTEGTADAASSKRIFSAEERRIAKKLSVGGEEVRDTSSPQSYAMLCSMALEAIDERLEKSDLLNSEQREAFAAARRVYTTRAIAGISRDEQDALRREVEAAHPEAGDRARFGIGCLRSLAGN